MSRCRPVPSALVLLTLILAAACGGGSTSPTSPSPLPNAAELLGERSLGSSSAPITLIEYSSLTCPHCATYHVTTWPVIRSAYVETGKVRLIYRDFPLDETALSGASLVRCAGPARYFEALDLLFQSYTTWSRASNPTTAMKQALAPIGLSGDSLDACLASSELREGILQIRRDGQSRDGISGTPTFLVNGQKIVGAKSYAEFDALFKSLLPQ